MKKLLSLQKALNGIVRDEKAAAIAEYALMAAFIGLAGLVVYTLMPPAIRAYLRRIYVVVSSPLP